MERIAEERRKRQEERRGGRGQGRGRRGWERRREWKERRGGEERTAEERRRGVGVPSVWEEVDLDVGVEGASVLPGRQVLGSQDGDDQLVTHLVVPQLDLQRAHGGVTHIHVPPPAETAPPPLPSLPPSPRDSSPLPPPETVSQKWSDVAGRAVVWTAW